MPAGRLQIDHFRARYLVPSGHPAPERLKNRLDDAAGKHLPRVLRAALGAWLDRDDPSVWLIRRLEVQIGVDAAVNPERTASGWAARVASALARTLSSGSSAEGVVRFENRAAYLASFLADLAAGAAWGRWYYHSFHGLQHLPTSGALRTALCDDLRTGLAALLHLAAAQRTRVLEALTAPDARRVLGALAAGGEDVADEARCWNALQTAWAALGRTRRLSGADAHLALELYLGACAADLAAGGPSLRIAAAALSRWLRVLAAAAPEQARELVAALQAADRARLYAAAAREVEALWPLHAAPAGLLEAVGRAAAQASRVADSAPAASHEPRHTPHGGTFLLLPFIDRLPLAAVAGHWPSFGEATASATLRLLVLVKCFGRPRAERVLGDPLLRELLGVPADATGVDLRRWLRQLPPDAPRELLRALADPDPLRAGQGEILLLLCARLPGAPVAVLLDAQHGVWLWAGGHAPGRTARLAERLAEFLRSRPRAPGRLVTDADLVVDLASGLRPYHPDLSVEGSGELLARLAREDPRLARLLAAGSRLAEELRYLALPASLGAARALDLALSVAAQRMLRQLAGRLPGFGASSLPYLYANFLDLSATLLEEPTRYTVQLGRAPLQLVLGLSGLARGEYRLSWLPERTFALFPPDGGQGGV